MHAVTGVFSYIGSYIARELLARGEAVKALSRSPDPTHPLSAHVGFGRLHFDETALAKELRGASTLYNTYWIRFPRMGVSWESVLANTRTLLRAARVAGVSRVVHFSVSNASATSPYAYFRAKAAAEREVSASGLSHAIVRPTLVVGREDVLLNNIAWALRRLPLFLVPGDGRYRVQPIAADDVARLAADLGSAADDVTVDAAGPDAVPFENFVRAVRAAVGARCPIVGVPATPALVVASAAGRVVGDVVVTRDELHGLMNEILVSREPPAGTTPFYSWVAENGHALGHAFVSDRRRNWGEPL